MNSELRNKAKHVLEKDFFKLMNPAVFGKNYGKVQRQGNLTCTTEKRKQ